MNHFIELVSSSIWQRNYIRLCQSINMHFFSLVDADNGGCTTRIIIMGSTMWKQSSNLQALHYDYYGHKLLWSK